MSISRGIDEKKKEKKNLNIQLSRSKIIRRRRFLDFGDWDIVPGWH